MSDRFTFIGVKTDDGFQQRPFNILEQHAIGEYIQQNYGRDTYITPNEFKNPTARTKDNIAQVKEIFIDFDYHLAAGFSNSEALTLRDILKPHFGKRMPEPSKMIHSGRGLHCYFTIKPNRDIAKYELTAHGIAQLIDQIISENNPLMSAAPVSDPRIGAERFIRAEGSYNTASKTPVSRIYVSQATYDIDVLITDYLPALHEIRKGHTITSQEFIQATAKRKYLPVKEQYTLNTWLDAVIEDIKTLQAIRDNDMRVINGKYKIGNQGLRNVMVFNFGIVCRWRYNDTEAVYESMEAFKNNFKALAGAPDYTQAEFEATYKSILKNGYKLRKNRWLVKALEITPDEQKQLKTLIDGTEKLRRKQIAKRIKKSKKAASNRAYKQGLKLQAISLKNSGLSYRDIAKQLNISHMTAKRYCD